MSKEDPHSDEDIFEDVIVVGAGPAGLTAATYLRRFHRSCLVLHSGGSRARWIPESNNCPGFPQGVSGVELLRRMQVQAEEFGTRFEQAWVDAIEVDELGFALFAQGRLWRARCVILATGVTDRLPPVPWVAEAVACGALRLCSICDAYEASDTRIGVYGPGQSIATHGSFLRSYSEQVFLLPTDAADGSELQQARQAGVHILSAGGTLDFDGKRCSYIATDGTATAFDTIYPFLGADTSAGMAAAIGAALSGTGELMVDAQQMTSVANLFAIGDVVSGLNQISVAVGQAAIAATCAHQRLPFVARAAGQVPG
ncbi:MAG: NAD(P)/FAD-dependent oxidoreductase [Pseudoxanthomonas sp.]